MMIRILPWYITKKFINIFLFSVLSGVAIYFILDGVQNIDIFIDKGVPQKTIVLYYLYHIPFILVLVFPVTAMIATVFSIGSLTRHNEIVAMKSLGYSLFQMMAVLMILGTMISIFSFWMSEGVMVHTNRLRQNIEDKYLNPGRRVWNTYLKDLEIKEPPHTFISIDRYVIERKTAYRVEIKKRQDSRLIYRLDSDSMYWKESSWVIPHGRERFFEEEKERLIVFNEPVKLDFKFSPQELLLTQKLPKEMSFHELRWFVQRVIQSGGEVQKWRTELYLRISYPLGSVIIILLSVPFVYNRRKKNIAIAFGISLGMCFFYFGVMKVCQTLGENGSIPPIIAAWFGNGVMGLGGTVNLLKVRK
jgi:lipopolysaccharide export system permease protein